MLRPTAVVTLLIALPSCSSADAPPPSRPEPAPTASALALVSAAAPTSATIAAAPAPDVAAGTERLAFDVAVFRREGATSRVTLDVPVAYAVEVDKEGPTLATCRASTSLGSTEMGSFWMKMRGLSVHASACPEEHDSRKCLEGETAADDHTDGRKVEWTGDERVVVQSTLKGKNGTPRIEDTVVVYDKAKHAAVRCGYTLLPETAHYQSQYQAVCKTLRIDASGPAKKGATRTATLTDAERVDLGAAPAPEKLRAMVESFSAAMGKRDMAAAKKFMLGPADCSKLFAKDAKRAADCKTEVQAASAALDGVKDWFPQNTEAGGIRVASGDGMSGLGAKEKKEGDGNAAFFEILVSPKGADCTVEIPLFVGHVRDDYRVFLPMKKDGPPKGKSKPAPTKKAP